MKQEDNCKGCDFLGRRAIAKPSDSFLSVRASRDEGREVLRVGRQRPLPVKNIILGMQMEMPRKLPQVAGAIEQAVPVREPSGRGEFCHDLGELDSGEQMTKILYCWLNHTLRRKREFPDGLVSLNRFQEIL